MGQSVGESHGGTGGRRRTDAGEDRRAVLGGGACHRDHQPGIVDQLAVVGQQRAVEAVLAHRGRHRDRFCATDPARARQHRGWRAGHHTQDIAGPEAHPNQRPLGAAHRGE